MTQITPMAAPATTVGTVFLRACALGLLVSTALIGLVLVTAGLPEGTASYIILGFGVAVVSGSAGLAMQAWLTIVPPDHPQVTQRYVAGLFGSFLLKLLVVTVAVVALVLLEVKFEAIAAFALSFVAVATCMHSAGVIVVSRALRARAVGSPAGGSADPTRGARD